MLKKAINCIFITDYVNKKRSFPQVFHKMCISLCKRGYLLLRKMVEKVKKYQFLLVGLHINYGKSEKNKKLSTSRNAIKSLFRKI